VAQAAKCLFCKLEALSSNPHPTKPNKQKTPKQCSEGYKPMKHNSPERMPYIYDKMTFVTRMQDHSIGKGQTSNNITRKSG
jgi:hypothetical protein